VRAHLIAVCARWALSGLWRLWCPVSIERSATSGALATLLTSGAIIAIVHQLAWAVVVWVHGRNRVTEIHASAQAEIAKMRAASEMRIGEMAAAHQLQLALEHQRGRMRIAEITATAEADVARIRAASETKITRDVRSPRPPVRPGARPA
jgi:hypothetical protein